MRCWFCGDWGLVDKIDTGETSWSDATGGEKGERHPVYNIKPAHGVAEGELIDCPFCHGVKV